MGDAAPGNPTSNILTFNGTTRLTPNVNAAWTVGGLLFAPGAGAFTIGGAALTLGNGGITVNSTTNQTITNSLSLSANQTWWANTRNLAATGAVNLGTASLSVNAATGRVVSLSGNVSGSGGLAKQGAGTLVLAGVNTYSGNTVVSAGTVNAQGNQVFGSGNLVFAGASTLTATGNRTFANTTRVNTTGTVRLTGGNMTFTGNFILGANSALNVGAPRVILNGGLSESGGPRNLTKTGTGSLIVNSGYSANGVLMISGGTVGLGPGVAEPAGNLRLNGGTLSMNATFTRALGTGAGQVRWTNSGGFAAYGGNLTVNIPGSPVWGSTTNFLGATRQLILGSALADGVVTWAGDFSLGTGGNRVINVADNTASAADRAVISGNITGGTANLVKIGNAPLTLTGNNAFTGYLHVAQGQVWVPSIGNASESSAAGAGSEIRLGNATTTGTLVYYGAGGTSNRDIRLPGTTGGGNITAVGAGALVLSGNVSILSGSAKTLALSGNSTANNTLSGVISNGAAALSIFKTGTGTWVLAGNNTYSGNTTLSAGVLAAGSNQAFGSGNFLMAGGTVASHGGPRTINNRTLLTANSQVAAGSNLTFSGNFINSGGNRQLAVNSGAYAYFTGNVLLSESTASRTLTFTGAGNSVVSGVVSNGASAASRLTKTGTGTLILSANNTYSGNTTLSAGVLAAGSNQAFGSGNFLMAGGTVASHGGPRTINNRTLLTANSQVAAGSNLTFSGNFINSGGNRQLAVNSGAYAYFTGNVLLSESTASRTLTFTGAGNSVVSGVVSNGASAASGLTKAGTGTLILSANNTYSGNTPVTGGILEIRAAQALGAASSPTTVSSGATLATNGTFTTNERLVLAGAGVGGNGALRHLGGSVVQGGNVTLTANTTIAASAGSLTFSAASGNAISGNFSLVLTGSGNITFAQRYNLGAGSLLKNGSGRVVLQSTASPYASGNVTVAAGVMEVNGVLASGGTLLVQSGAAFEGSGTIQKAAQIAGIHAPGAGGGVGNQTFSNSLNYQSGSTLQWQLVANSDTGPGTNFDQVLVTGGNLTVSANASVSLIFNSTGSTVDWSDSFWSSNRTWTAVAFSSSGSSTGVFGAVSITADSLGNSLASVHPGAFFTAVASGSNIIIEYHHAPEPSSLVLVVLAAGCLMVRSRRRRRSNDG